MSLDAAQTTAWNIIEGEVVVFQAIDDAGQGQHIQAFARLWLMFDEIRGAIAPTCPGTIAKLDKIRDSLRENA